MKRPVYSEVFLAEQGLDTFYEIAPDFENIRVLRCIDAYWGGGIAISPSIRVTGHSGQTIVEFHVPPGSIVADIDSQCWQWQGRQVIPPGGVIFASVTDGPADITISGYTLVP